MRLSVFLYDEKKNLLRILKLTCNNMEIIVKKKQKMN